MGPTGTAGASPDGRDRGARRAAARRRKTAGRRRLALLGLAAASLIAGVAVGAGGGGGSTVTADDPEADLPKLPRGGRSLLPERRMVAYYGAPGSIELGTLGIGTPREAGKRLLDQAAEYGSPKEVMPVLELIVTVAASDPGDDGEYALRESNAVIKRYLKEARAIRGLLLLDIQPGRAEFEDEIDRIMPFLREPDVGLALDPEWHVGPDEVPGQVIGSVEASTVNGISAELAAMVAELELPEKLFVVHQFTPDMIAGGEVRDRPGLATVINIDGFGDAPNKIAKYEELAPRPSSGLGAGFKLFFNEDIGLMTPEQVLDLKPKPDLVVYE